jgi:hypothetical protein
MSERDRLERELAFWVRQSQNSPSDLAKFCREMRVRDVRKKLASLPPPPQEHGDE